MPAAGRRGRQRRGETGVVGSRLQVGEAEVTGQHAGGGSRRRKSRMTHRSLAWHLGLWECHLLKWLCQRAWKGAIQDVIFVIICKAEACLLPWQQEKSAFRGSWSISPSEYSPGAFTGPCQLAVPCTRDTVMVIDFIRPRPGPSACRMANAKLIRWIKLNPIK